MSDSGIAAQPSATKAGSRDRWWRAGCVRNFLAGTCWPLIMTGTRDFCDPIGAAHLRSICGSSPASSRASATRAGWRSLDLHDTRGLRRPDRQSRVHAPWSRPRKKRLPSATSRTAAARRPGSMGRRPGSSKFRRVDVERPIDRPSDQCVAIVRTSATASWSIGGDDRGTGASAMAPSSQVHELRPGRGSGTTRSWKLPRNRCSSIRRAPG